MSNIIDLVEIMKQREVEKLVDWSFAYEEAEYAAECEIEALLKQNAHLPKYGRVSEFDYTKEDSMTAKIADMISDATQYLILNGGFKTND